MDKFQIETAQNVTINQNVAHITTRIGSILIDWMFITVYVIVISILMNALNFDIGQQWAVLMLLGLPIFFYNLLFEVLMNGQSPGKRINQLRVVKLDGSKPTFGSYLLRWMLRIIDISLASGSVALLTILLNGRGQRLGDLAAGTTVVSEKKRISLRDTIIVAIPDDYTPTFPQVTTLSDTDIQIIKSLFSKAKTPENQKIILKLHIKITELLELKTDMSPVDFIAVIIKDYNYYTQQM